MALLNEPQGSLAVPDVTTEAPRSPVSPGALESSYAAVARGMEKLGAGAEDLATPLAESQAASDLQNQRVTLGADGKIQVMNPARSLIFGRAGEAYGNAVIQGTASQAETLVDKQLADIHNAHIGDPNAQATADRAFISGLSTGNPLTDQIIRERASRTAVQHEIANSNFTTQLNLRNQQIGVNASITSLEEQAASQARAGMGPGNPDFDKTMSELNQKRNDKQSNPLMKDPPELDALQRKQFDLRLAGERLVGGIPSLIDQKGMNEARRQVHEMLDNAALEPSTRARLRYEAGQALAEATPAWREKNRMFDATVNKLEEDFAAHKGTGPDGLNAWGTAEGQYGGQAWSNQLIEQMRLGREQGYEREPELEALAASSPWLKTMSKLSPEQRAVLTTPYQGMTINDALGPGASAAPTPATTGGATVQPAVATQPPEPPRSEWPKGAATVARTSTGQIVYVDKDGKALPDDQQPKAQPAVATAPGPAPATTGAGDYKSRVAEIESSSGRTSSNIYQFQPATWAKYGSGDINNRADQEAAMDRLTAANRETLRYGLGREPTDAELYLAHQQGAQGFLHLLAEPNRRAGDIVGDAAINGNGGNSSMTAAQFLNMWENKFNRTQGRTIVAGGDGVGGFTHEQIRANPALLWVQTLGMDKDPTEKFGYYSALVGANQKLMDLGNAPNPSQWAEIQQLHDMHKGDPKYEEKFADAAGQFAAISAESMPPAQRAAFDQQVQQAIANNQGDPWVRALANAAQAHLAKLDKNWDEKPMSMAANTGMIPRQAVPLDWSNPNAMRQSLTERDAIAQKIATTRGGPALSAFDKGSDDLTQVKNFLGTANPADKAAFYGMLTSTLSPDVLHATMRALASNNPAGMAEARAGTMMGDPKTQDIGRSIIAGLEAMKIDNGKFNPSKGDPEGYQAELEKHFPAGIFSPFQRTTETGAYNVMGLMIQARMAFLNAQRGATGFDKATLKQAVDDVTGGVVYRNGGYALTPQRGVDQTGFDFMIDNLTPERVQGAVTGGGDPVTLDMIKRSGQFESASTDGHYFVRMPGGNPIYVQQRLPDGSIGPLELDLSKDTAPPPRQGGPQAVAPGPHFGGWLNPQNW